MAKKYLDYDGLAYFWEKIKAAIAVVDGKVTGKLDDVNYDTTNKKLYKTKNGVNTDIVSVSTIKTDMNLTKADVGLGNVEDGAQVNVLEGIQANGQTVPVTNKIANIPIPEGAAASTTTPIMDGTATTGTELAFARGDHVHPTDTSRAPLASPALTGTPTAPTAAVATDSTQIATTAFVHDVVDALDTGVSDVTVDGTSVVTSGIAVIDLTGKAPLASPALTGTPTAPTATAGTNSTQIATTAFVTSAIQTAQTGAASFQGTAPTTFAPTNYKTGYYWVIGTAGTYAGETCEPGDMIFAVADYNSAYSASDFNVIQTNLDITSVTNSEIDTIVAS